MLVGCSVGLIFLPYRMLSASDYDCNFDSVSNESQLQYFHALNVASTVKSSQRTHDGLTCSCEFNTKITKPIFRLPHGFNTAPSWRIHNSTWAFMS